MNKLPFKFITTESKFKPKEKNIIITPEDIRGGSVPYRNRLNHLIPEKALSTNLNVSFSSEEVCHKYFISF